MFSLDANATREPNQHYTEPFHLVTWGVKRVVLQGENSGESIDHVRTVLIDKDGETLSFVSMGVLGSLDLIRALRGDGPYDPPIPIVVTEATTRNKFRVWKLRILHDRSKQPTAK